jgi:hypothetical protein
MGSRLLTRGVELWCGCGYGILSEETRFGADADGRPLQHNTLHTAACKEKDNIVAELSGVASLSSCVKEMSCSQVWFLRSKGSPLTSPIPCLSAISLYSATHSQAQGLVLPQCSSCACTVKEICTPVLFTLFRHSSFFSTTSLLS